MANETPSRPPPPFLANAILNFHFDFPHTSLITKNFLVMLLLLMLMLMLRKALTTGWWQLIALLLQFFGSFVKLTTFWPKLRGNLFIALGYVVPLAMSFIFRGLVRAGHSEEEERENKVSMNMIFCNEIGKHFWKYVLSWLIGYILTSRDVFYFLNVQAHCVYMTCYLSQCWPTVVVMIKDIDNNKLLEIWAVTKWQKSNYQKYGQWQSKKMIRKRQKL